MTRRSLAFAAVPLVIAYFVHASESAEQMASQTKVPSPDAKHVVIYNPDNVEIHDRGGSKIYTISRVLPVYALEWTSDSTTVMIVAHLAGGSSLTLAYFDGKAWKHFDAWPSGAHYDRFAVIAAKPVGRIIEVSYKTKEIRNEVASYHIQTFTIDPATRVRASERVKTISRDEFYKLPSLGKREKRKKAKSEKGVRTYFRQLVRQEVILVFLVA